MKVMLDTSAYSALLKGNNAIAHLLEKSNRVYVPAVVLGELQSGFRRGSQRQENAEILAGFLAKPSVHVAEVTEETAMHYGEVDAFLREKGRPIPRNEVWIAACALEKGCVLATLDAHFREIPTLIIRP